MDWRMGTGKVMHKLPNLGYLISKIAFSAKGSTPRSYRQPILFQFQILLSLRSDFSKSHLLPNIQDVVPDTFKVCEHL